MDIEDFLADHLWGLVANRLNWLARFPGAPNVMKTWRPDIQYDTTWFYEGTIRAVTYDYINRFLVEHALQDEWLLLAEQHYPNFPEYARADLTLMGHTGQWIFVEIKADFNQATAIEDIGQLAEVKNQLQTRYQFGLLLYSMWNFQPAIDRWQQVLDVNGMQESELGVARPLIRRPMTD